MPTPRSLVDKHRSVSSLLRQYLSEGTDLSVRSLEALAVRGRATPRPTSSNTTPESTAPVFDKMAAASTS